MASHVLRFLHHPISRYPVRITLRLDCLTNIRFRSSRVDPWRLRTRSGGKWIPGKQVAATRVCRIELRVLSCSRWSELPLQAPVD